MRAHCAPDCFRAALFRSGLNKALELRVRIRNPIHIVLVLLACCSLTACPPKYYSYSIFNNSGAEVSVVNVSEVLRIPNGGTRIVQTSPEMEIHVAENKRWRYRPSMLPLTVLDSKEIYHSKGRDPIQVQLESDGAIYFLHSSERPPLKIFAPQPTGFPVSPINEL